MTSYLKYYIVAALALAFMAGIFTAAGIGNFQVTVWLLIPLLLPFIIFGVVGAIAFIIFLLVIYVRAFEEQ